MKHLPELRRLGLFDRKVPRFTSYPPATHFTPAVGPEAVARWQGAMPDGAETSIYVHIPFCRRLCWFCACRTQGVKTDSPLEPYVASVLAEARSARARMPDRVAVRRLHLGGGTPTILSSNRLDQLLAGLDQIFGLGGLEEFSVEIDPMEVDRERLTVLKSFGLNRASLGVQDFDPAVQAAIGRTQPFSQTAAVAGDLRALGIDAINIDLLYGLPYQTTASLSDTLEKTRELSPSRLALYGYAHVPWMSKRQTLIPTEALPGAEDRFRQFELARKTLTIKGYRQIGIDHFALPDDGLSRALDERRLGRNFQGYTDDRAPWLVAFGASAISRYPEGFAQNEPTTNTYRKIVSGGGDPVSRGYALTRADRMDAAMVEQLMCYHEVDVAALPDGREAARDRLSILAASCPEALRFENDRLSMEGWALPLVRILAARLLESGAAASERHQYSSAI